MATAFTMSQAPRTHKNAVKTSAAMTDRERRRQAFLGVDPPAGSEGWRERVRLRAGTPGRVRLAATILLAACERGEIAGWRPPKSKLATMKREGRALQAEAERWAAELKGTVGRATVPCGRASSKRQVRRG